MWSQGPCKAPEGSRGFLYAFDRLRGKLEIEPKIVGGGNISIQNSKFRITQDHHDFLLIPTIKKRLEIGQERKEEGRRREHRKGRREERGQQGGGKRRRPCWGRRLQPSQQPVPQQLLQLQQPLHSAPVTAPVTAPQQLQQPTALPMQQHMLVPLSSPAPAPPALHPSAA